MRGIKELSNVSFFCHVLFPPVNIGLDLLRKTPLEMQKSHLKNLDEQGQGRVKKLTNFHSRHNSTDTPKCDVQNNRSKCNY